MSVLSVSEAIDFVLNKQDRAAAVSVPAVIDAIRGLKPTPNLSDDELRLALFDRTVRQGLPIRFEKFDVSDVGGKRASEYTRVLDGSLTRD